jgi:transcriptional regulator with XRE-family HTH domain
MLSERVRSERTRREWSLARLAEVSGVSRAMISKIERGESSPTAAVLGKLSAALEVSVSNLLAPTAKPVVGGVRRDDERPDWTDPETGYLRRQISAPEFGADVTEVLLPAGARIGYPAAAFAFIDQLLWILDGRLTLGDGSAVLQLNAGDTLQLGPPTAREFANETLKPCRYLVVVLRKPSA